jgi:pilus assembly protein CpaE
MILAVVVAEDGRRQAPLAVLVAGGDAAQREQVRGALLALEEPAVSVSAGGLSAGPAREGAAAPKDKTEITEAEQADVVMLVVGADKDGALACLQDQDRRAPRPALFALLSEPSEPLIRRVLNAGADEVLLLPAEPHALMRVLLKVSEARRRSLRETGAAVFSLTSVMGGVGLTTLSANLGLALLRASGARVALVDLDLQQGGLGVLLNVGSERTILPLAGMGDRLDSIALESALTRHATGLYLLAAPKRIEESEQISDLTVGAVLDLMSRLFDYVVIDCGRHIDENAVAAWERSSEVLYVLEQSVAAGRCALRFLDLFGRLKIARAPRLVLNRYNPRHPITEAQISAILSRPIYARIPRDDRVMENAAALAKTPWQVAPRSALVRAYEELAARLSAGRASEAEAYAAGAAGFVARLLAALGARA